MDGGGNSHLGQAAANELKHGHLGCGVLHGHAVRTQAKISAAAVDFLPHWIIQVTVYNLLRQSERPVEPGGVDYRKCLMRMVLGEFFLSKNCRFFLSYSWRILYIRQTLHIMSILPFNIERSKRSNFNYLYTCLQSLMDQ